MEEIEEDLSEFTFMKFTSTYFVSNSSYSFSKRMLREPLLHHDDESEKQVAINIWVMILRFMGELPEASVRKKKYTFPAKSDFFFKLESLEIKKRYFDAFDAFLNFLFFFVF